MELKPRKVKFGDISSVTKRNLSRNSEVKVSEGAVLFTVAVVEYLCETVMKKAGDVCNDEPQRIRVNHIFKVVHDDPELDALFLMLEK